ncbi:Tetratricopeptide repeat-containing protein [Flavobacterium swingsii]|uniref:Tetratricopeptide repeat-containing protein n=1 Tax=Flavobacterium swingsii TaxID=498292 RepID=A0A1I0XTZ4_9FLAO|nr:tetratricopeptide repeat protein [Flavobacterium swingsii]SFB04471.1 Tetratricopeptide repeat-containing protein [Flavobacterium swingsii]
MNKVKFFSIALVAFGFSTYAQEVELAKKAIDAEQYEKAKSILKAGIQAKPDNGKIAFLLGNVYLQQSQQDSAKMFFQKGLTAKEFASFNYIGLGQLDLNSGNTEAAQFNFDQATKDIKKKDIEQFIYIGKAFTNAEKPDFKKAIANLTKAKAINPNDAQIQMALGDAYYGDRNQNDAYAAYRNAFEADPTLLKAKMQLGVLLKGAKAFPEAKSAFDGVVAINPNYGPVYRELAETYYQWGANDKTKYKEYTAKGLEYYEKYMSLTDYSLASRFRHAEFLILAKDYKALEKEAEAMKKLDNVNPRILRYLGYALYENGNFDGAIQALTDYTTNPKNKIIGRDYLYLGLAELKKATPAPATPEAKSVINDVLFQTAVANLRKAVDLDKPMANDLNDIGKIYFEQKLYKYAADIYEVATSNPNSKNYLYDNFYLGYALYFDNSGKDAAKMNVVALKKADKAFDNVTVASPTTQDAYIYRARVNSLLQNDAVAEEQMAKSYADYIRVVTEKGTAEVEKSSNKTKFVEAYQNLALHYKKDKVKATEYITKALAIEPTNSDSLSIQKSLK